MPGSSVLSKSGSVSGGSSGGVRVGAAVAAAEAGFSETYLAKEEAFA